MNPSEEQIPKVGNLTQLSRHDFSRAYRKGYLRSILNWVRNKNNELLPFDEVMRNTPMRGQHYVGIRQIETGKIIGSVSRYLDFDRAFLPKQTHTRSRWESIDRAFFQDVILPPIEVYKLGKTYFVKDGNHRVSVARERGQSYMDAYVIEIDSPVEFETPGDIDSFIADHEYREFLKQSKADQILPDEVFRFSIPGQYDKLLQHISVHRWFMGEKFQRPVSDEEALLGWYKDVYKPLVRIIRKNEILKEFPTRTETDLYLWIIEHRWFLSEELNRRVSLESAALNFTNKFSTRPFHHISQFFKWLKRKIARRFSKKAG